jgi:hypothetical protein
MSSLACPAAPPGTAEERPTLAGFFRRFGPDYLERTRLSPEQARVLRHLIECRTAAMGGYVDTCDHCARSWDVFHSCRDRHCPTCQGAQQRKWIESRLERVLPTHHFHVVFTLPAQLRPIALANRRLVYDLLFASATDTLLELARTHWEAIPGITAVLHTWTRQMEFHPHLHCIVTGGGLALDGECWIACRPAFLFAVKALSALFRGKFLDRLVTAYQGGELQFTGTSAPFADADQFAALRRQLYDEPWVVYAKRPFGGPQQVVRYLGAYTHRVALSNSRLVSFDSTNVLFRTHGKRTCALHPDEFLRRFLLHVLPSGFRKIRHYGLLAPANVQTKLAVAANILDGARRARRHGASCEPPSVPMPTGLPTPDGICPACGVGRLRRHTIPAARGPPRSPGNGA